MNKVDFIKRSNKLKEDDLVEYNQKNRHILAIKVCYVVLFIEMLCLFFAKGQNYGIYALFFAFSGADGFEEYRMKKNKFYLLASAICLLTAVLALYNFVIELVGA